MNGKTAEFTVSCRPMTLDSPNDRCDRAPAYDDRSPATMANTRSRRRFLGATAGLLALPMLAVPKRSRASVAEPRTLSFLHTHTAERLSLAYAAGDTYFPEALATVNRFLRDFRNGEIHPIDPRLLDQLHALSSVTGSKASYEVISGYRSPATNQALHERSQGVATRSLHLEGRAIDIRLPDVPLADLRDAAVSLRAGGVGYYAGSRFVHLDTGRPRRW